MAKHFSFFPFFLTQTVASFFFFLHHFSSQTCHHPNLPFFLLGDRTTSELFSLLSNRLFHPKNNNKSSIAHCTQIMKIVDKAKRRNKRQLSNSSSAHERTTLIEFPPPPSSIPYHIIISNVENEIRPIERRCLPPPIGRSRGTRQLRVQCLWIKKEETR